MPQLSQNHSGNVLTLPPWPTQLDTNCYTGNWASSKMRGRSMYKTSMERKYY